jgi:hypothetical protein
MSKGAASGRWRSQMLFALFWVCVGLFIGWNLPQPLWARELQEKVMAVVKAVIGK